MRAKGLSRIIAISLLLFVNLIIQQSFAQKANEAATTPTSNPPKTDIPTPTPDATAHQRFVDNLIAIGVTFNQVGETIEVLVDQKKAIAALPLLESQGVIPKIAAKDIKNSPLALSVGVVGISFTIVIMNTLFAEKPDLQKVKVKTYVLPMDGKNKELCFSFDYTRDMYKKMDLDTLTPKDFIMNTPGFSFTTWCRSNMEKEAKNK